MRRLSFSLPLTSQTLSLLLLGGCAPTLSSFTPAHVAPSGHVQAEVGMDVSIPAGIVDELMDTAKTVARTADRQAANLTEEQRRVLLRGAATTLLNPPSMSTHLGVAVGVYEDVEVGGRLFSGGWRLGGRYQFLDQKTQSVDLSAGLGISRYSFSLGIPEVPILVDVEDYSRWMVDIPVLVGKHGNWYRWWAGPKFLMGTFDAGVTLTNPIDDQKLGFTMDGTSWYLGGQAGAALGYKWIFVAAELTVMHVGAKAEFAANGGTESASYKPTVSGTIWYPGLGLMGEF